MTSPPTPGEREKPRLTKEQVCERLGHVVGRFFELPSPEGGICRRCGEFIHNETTMTHGGGK